MGSPDGQGQALPDSYPYERAQRFGVRQRGTAYPMPRQTLSPPRADETETASTGFPETISAYQAAQPALIDREESGFAHAMPRRGMPCVVNGGRASTMGRPPPHPTGSEVPAAAANAV